MYIRKGERSSRATDERRSLRRREGERVLRRSGGGVPEFGVPAKYHSEARTLCGVSVRRGSLTPMSEDGSLFLSLSTTRPLSELPPPSRDDRLIGCASGMRLIEKPAGGEKQLTWDIYFNYNVSAYYAENAGDVHTGACGAGDGGCVSGAPRGGKCEKMALSPPGADGPQIKWGGSPRRQYETDLSTQEETEKQSARFP